MDKDNNPIGGLSHPMQPTRQLFYATVILDLLAILAGFFIDRIFAAGILLYILASRAYSFRGIRLKKYPVIGYLVVIIFQGAVTFFLSWHGSNKTADIHVPVLPMLASTCLIGGYYPLTQIYQHEDDFKDGVRTISYMLGKKRTFLFCGILFLLATVLIYLTFQQKRSLIPFLIFAGCMVPVIIFFSGWMKKVWNDESKANFTNSLHMNVLASACTAGCFITLIILKQHLF